MNTDDRRLIADALAGRTAAFGELVVRHQDRLYNATLRIVSHPDDAADIVQEAFINAFQSLASFKGDSEFYTWLYRIAFNAAATQARKRRPRVFLDSRDSREGTPVRELADPSPESRPETAAERRDEEKKLQTALERLSHEHRSVLVLKDMEGWKYEEIAEVLAVPIGTIRSRIHRARLELRDLLEEKC